LANPILIYRPPRAYLSVSTPNTIHHIAVWLSVCLSDSRDLDRCLSIFVWLSACEQAGFAFVGALEFTIMIRFTITNF